MTPAHVLKRLFLSFLIGAVAGDVMTVLFAPNALEWFATPGTGTALCNCAETAKATAQSLVRAQLVGTGIGAVVGMVLGELGSAVWRSRKKKAPARVDAPPPA
jgi:hypothetical protein